MNTLIIGAGAAGLTAAIKAAEAGALVTVIEHENKPGKKILVTGNGKCNITNLNMNPEKYYGDKNFIKDVLNAFGSSDTIDFFNGLGLFTKDKKGYVYPKSEQASSVLNALKEYAAHLGVKIKASNNIEKIEIKDGKFHADMGILLVFDKLIIAAGGMAAPKTGSDGSGYQLARLFGHNIIPPKPALTALICENNMLNKASGVRVNAKVSILNNDKVTGSDIGEVQITDYGISGIPIFNISRLADSGSEVVVDFMPDTDFEKAENIISDILHKRAYMTVFAALNGYFNDKLTEVFLVCTNINKSKKAEELTDNEIKHIVSFIKNYKMIVNMRRGFDFAQVTQGGVDTKEINSKTMESRLVKNLYFAGEIIDVDGICGGYNLQFAWATGAIAGGNCKA